MSGRPGLCLLLLLLGCGPTEVLSPLVVSVLYPVEGQDPGITSGLERGVLEARVGSEFVIEEQTPASDEEARALLDQALLPRQGRRLVITGGGVYATSLNGRDCELNGTDVLLLEGKPRPCDSLRSVQFQTYVPAFLAGVLAVSSESVAPRRAVGAISATPSTEIALLIEGFVAGVAYVGGQAQTLALDSFDAQDLADVAAARAQIRALVEAVDVLLVAGDTDIELVLEVVRAYNDEHGTRPVRLIGIDRDLRVLDAELTLGSVVRRFDVEVRSSILAAQVDAFAPGQVVRGYRDGQTELFINPFYADTALGSAPFPDCQACKTLTDAVRQAQLAAEQAAEQAAPG